MNIQLTEVLTDVMGITGQAIIRAIVAGERDPKVLSRHRNNRVKASAEEIARALTGNWRDEHLFVLGQALSMYDDIARHMAECDAKLQALLAELGQAKVDLGKAPRTGSKLRAEFDVRQMLANWAGVDLTRINGLEVTTVMKVLTEIGPDLGRFANVKHFCSWLGLCPGTKISGGKVLVKLFGLVGGLVTFGCYYWLKPKFGTFGAVAVSGVIGVVVAIGLMAMIRN